VNPSTTPTPTPTPPGEDTGDRSVKGLVQALREVAGDGPVLVRENWRLGVAGLAAAVVLVLILALAAQGLHTGVETISGWLQHGTIVHAVNDPVRSWMDTHTAGLPVTGGDLWLVWLTALTTIYPAALLGSTYARAAWALLAAMTSAAAYAGAPHGTGVAAAALTVLLWLLLSLPVYSRRRTGTSFEQLTRDRARRRATRTTAATTASEES
jgi:hypothetical protein